MDTKLTLKLNSNSISKAKQYSSMHNISVSSMVEKFFDGLTVNSFKKEEFKYSSIVSELSGIISVPDDYDYKKAYLEHLESKYE